MEQKRKSKKYTSVTVIIILIISVLSLYLTLRDNSDVNNLFAGHGKQNFGQYLSVDFIDVGQGDSVLITCDGTAILVDAGETGEAANVINYLRKKGVFELSLVVATHPHSDHIGAMSQVIDSFIVSDVMMPEIPESIIPTTACYRKLLSSVSEKAKNVIKAEPGLELDYGDIHISVFGPCKDYDDLNNMSVVLKLNYGRTSVLLTGDAENNAENDIMKKNFDISADLLKIGHHGSKTSSSNNWLKEVSPSYAVISCGTGNDYGHPHKTTLKKLEKLGIEYYRTDLSGSLEFVSDGNSFVLK